MATINPYLAFNGNCAEAFEFYKSVFGGEYSRISKYKEMPPMPGMEIHESAKELIMHVSLPISKETILMGSDANPGMGNVTAGKNISISVGTESKEKASHIFNALSSGGKVTMPIADMFWGAYFGMLKDKYGFIWMVNYDYPKK